MKIHELMEQRNYISTPFPASREPRILFHGTHIEFDKFERHTHGIYVTPVESWAREHYGNIVIPMYANVRKPYKPSEEEVDWFYDRAYDDISKLLEKLTGEGYDCCKFGGESEAMVLFNNIELANALTGNRM